MNICTELLKILYPNKCMFCDDIIDEDNEFKTCEYCGNDLIYSQSRNSVFYYSEIVRECIHRFKYSDHPEYAPFIAKYMYIELLNNNMTDFDMIISVPMYYSKEKRRGFNQAALLANEISRLTGIVHDREILIRIINTAPQSKTDAEKKFDNLKKAFKVINSDRIKNKKILLTDDIYTSGSTVKHCKNILAQNGAAYIDHITFAAAHIVNGSETNVQNKIF